MSDSGDSRDAPVESDAHAGAVEVTDAAGDAGDAEAGPSCAADDTGLPRADGTWQVFGEHLGHSASSPLIGPALTLLPDDRPVVSWFDGTGIQTRIWQVTACGGQWIDPVGTIDGDSPALATDAQGAPILAFDDDAVQPSRVSVRRFDGTTFVPLGASLPSTNHGVARAVSEPALAADALGNLVLAWVDFPASLSSSIQAARWNGTNWLPMTDAKGALGLLSTGSPSGPSLALTPTGGVVAAWLTTGHATAVARYVSGTAWTTVGTPPSGAAGGGESNGPLVAVDRLGTINLAWKDRTGTTYRTFAGQYDGATWKTLGSALATAGSADEDYALMVDSSGAPVVMDGELLTPQPGSRGFNYRWNGSAWESPAPILPDPAGISGIAAPTILSDSHGRWVAAWRENSNDVGISFVVARWQP